MSYYTKMSVTYAGTSGSISPNKRSVYGCGLVFEHIFDGILLTDEEIKVKLVTKL